MDNKIYTINYYPSAYKDLEEIKRYWEDILETSADDFMVEIYQITKRLEDSPLSHHQPANEYLRAKGYRILPIKNYYVFYMVKETEVQLHRVLYSKMDFTKLF